MEERVVINAAPLELEGVYATGEQSPAAGGVVICHPHPQYGGDMYSNVVMALQAAALEAGYASLRFNFRGVGASQGAYEGGVGEREDVRSALSYVRDRLTHETDRIIVSGYSFGAFVGSAAAVSDGGVAACILVSPPVDMMDFGHLKAAPMKVLFIAGDRDPFCPLASLEAFRKEMAGENSLQAVSGADHFYFGLEQQVTEHAVRFLRGEASLRP